MSSELKPYARYRDSGVEWLGEVPEHWDAVNSKRYFRHRNEKASADDLQLTASQKHGIISQKKYAELENQKVMQVIRNPDILKKVRPNDFIISMRSFQGGLELSRVQGSISSAYVTIEPTGHTLSQYFRWVFKSVLYIQALGSTSNLVRDGQALRFDNFAQVTIPLPPLPEQRAIADYLDTETGRIDALISEQRELIELLKEKRQALISHCVTRGLDPDVPMKDSGVEWLGEVPEHWQVKRLKYVAKLELSNVDKKSGDGQPEVRLCNYTDVYYNERIDGDISFMRATASPDQIDRLSLVQGDVVITKDSEDPQDIGVSAYVASTLPDLVCGYHLALLRSKETYEGEFLYRFLSSQVVRERFAVEARGMTRFGLGKYSLENLELPLPPLPEQQAIADYLDAETARIDALITEAEETITLMQEHRSALISACVTGKVRVPGVADPAAEEQTA